MAIWRCFRTVGSDFSPDDATAVPASVVRLVEPCTVKGQRDGHVHLSLVDGSEKFQPL